MTPHAAVTLGDADFLRDYARVEPEGEYEISFIWGMPLYECARNGKHEMARILLEGGADPNGQVYASGTPLSEAYGQRNDEMIALRSRGHIDIPRAL